jgi:hypothetical protein
MTVPARITIASTPALAAAAGERAGMRFLEFFAPTSATRAAPRTAEEFWPQCGAGVPSIGAVQPVHVAT